MAILHPGPQGLSLLFVLWDGGGNVPPMLGLVRRCLARGHRCRVLGGRSLRSQVEAAGCGFVAHTRGPHHSARRRDEDLLRDWGGNPLATLNRLRETLLFGPLEAIARDVTDALDAYGPMDAVVTDAGLLGAMCGAEAAGLPYLVVHPQIYSMPAPGLPPPGSGWMPPRHGLQRWVYGLAQGLVRRFWRSGSPALCAARKALGLDALDDPLALFERAHRQLILTHRGFDFEAEELPANAVYAGPQLDDPAWSQGPEAAAVDWPRSKGSRPRVLLAVGSTYQGQESFLGRMFEALAAMEVDAIATLGHVFSASEFAAPDHVQVVSAAPHHRLLPEADAMVSHGGHGSVLKALSHGVPLLCAPFGRDQPDNAARIEAAGVGLRISRRARAALLRRALRRILQEPGFRQRAQAMAAEIQRDLLEDRASVAIESCLPQENGGR